MLAVDQSEACSVFIQCVVQWVILWFLGWGNTHVPAVMWNTRFVSVVVSSVWWETMTGGEPSARLLQQSVFLSTPAIKRCSLTLSLFVSLVLLSLVTHRFCNQLLESNIYSVKRKKVSTVETLKDVKGSSVVTLVSWFWQKLQCLNTQNINLYLIEWW